jgi:protein SCO1/2
LITSAGETFTEKDMLEKWSLVYFGFTNCPDICPAELDKIGAALNRVGE